MNLKNRVEKLEAKSRGATCFDGMALIIYKPGQEIDGRCKDCGGNHGFIALPDNGR